MSLAIDSCEHESADKRTRIIGSLKKAEQREIERHKYCLSVERGQDVGFEAAAEDWLTHHAQAWREMRQRKMLDLQREEINRYKWIQSEHAHRDLGGAAVLDWIQKYAAHWRDWYEEEFVEE